VFGGRLRTGRGDAPWRGIPEASAPCPGVAARTVNARVAGSVTGGSFARGLARVVATVVVMTTGPVSGCSRPEPEVAGRLRVGIEAQVSALDPRFAADANSSRIAGLVHCALAEPDAAGGWAPSLATLWREVDEVTWELALRSDARFHDGTPVTAADVVATYRSVLDAANGSPKRAALPFVESVEDAGDGRVRFRLSSPDVAFLEGASIGILPAALTAKGRLTSEPPVGCGPYRIAAATDDAILLTANEEWYGGTVTLESIEFRVVPDTVMRTLQLRNGDLDFVQNALEPDAVRHLQSSAPDLAVSATPYDASQYLGFNHRHPALADVRVRRAIALAIDRDAIARHLLGGQAETATGLLPSQHPFYSPDVRRYARDPERARKLLEKAGFSDPDGAGPLPRLRLRYTTSTVELRRRIAEVVASDLAAIGIEISIESYEWGTFFDDIARGDYDLYALAWIGVRDPDLYRVVFHSKMTPPAGGNRGFFASARMDRQTERGRRTHDPALRRAVYDRVQRMAARKLPYVPLWWPKNVVVRTKRLEGFTPHPAGELAGLARARLK
jgi:peptide/nickel transport system substrate-binding protein